MNMRYNKVVRAGDDNDARVYSLVTDTNALYVIPTGNANGLLNEESHGEADAVVLDETTRPFIEEIFDNEERIKTTPSQELAREPGALVLPYSDILAANADTEAVEPLLRLSTRQGDLSFKFTYSSGSEVEALVQALTS